MRLRLPHEPSTPDDREHGHVLVVLKDVVKCWRSGDPGNPVTRPVLQGVSLTLSNGETLAILADRGSGATTLLLAIAGLARPDSGEVRWRNSAHDRQRMLLVPTESVLPPAWTPRDAISAAVPPEWPVSVAAAAITRALNLQGLTPMADTPLRRLPSAAAWRAALAAARLAAPRVLLVDREPDDAIAVGLAPAALAVAERAPAPGGASLLVLRPGALAPHGAHTVSLRNGRLHGLHALPDACAH